MRLREELSKPALRILDVGCGTSPLLFTLAAGAASRHTQSPRSPPEGHSHGGGYPPRALQSRTPADFPDGWSSLHGVDFAEAAIAFLSERAAAAPAAARLRFSVGDARSLEAVADGAADVVVDKGCLDCFVTGEGDSDVGRYLATVQRVLAPGGRALLFAVNGADVGRLLASGEVVPDAHAVNAGGARAAA